MTTATMILLHDSFHGIEKPSQRYGVERVVTAPDDRRVKLVVDIDSSYAVQTRIASYVWHDGWQQVLTIYGTDPTLPATDIGYVPAHRSHEKEDVIEQIADELLNATLAVIA